MKILKRIFTIVCCIALSIFLFSCSDKGENKEPETSTTQSTVKTETTTEKPTEEIDLKGEDFLKKVIDANLMTNLLQRNQSVYEMSESNYDETVECYFKNEMGIIRVNRQDYKDTDEFVIVGEFGETKFISRNGGRFCVRAFVDEYGTEMEKEETMWFEDTIAYPLVYDNLSFREETDEYYIFENINDDKTLDDYIQTVCYVNKETLNVERTVNVNDDIIAERNFVYNKPLEIMNSIDSWTGEKKTVTVVFETKDGAKYTEKYEIPFDWDISIENSKYESLPVKAFLDEGYTKEYEYPGDNKDYTIYVKTMIYY